MDETGIAGQPAVHADLSALEALLVVRGMAGDSAAFEQLVHRTARWLFARIYLQLGRADRCEDLVQEVFLLAWRKLPSLSDPNAFRGWLAAIAHGVVIDAIKADSRKKRRGIFFKRDRNPQQQMLDVADDQPGPVQQLEQSEQRNEVLEMLRDLPREYQDVLTLRYLAGADYATISKQLAISNGSLRGLLNRGMKMLRERLTADNADERG